MENNKTVDTISTDQGINTEDSRSFYEKPQDQFLWIINEGLLRDEGTLYGIAGAEVEKKIEAINNYYSGKKATCLQKIESIKNQISLLQENIDSTLAKIQRIETDGVSFVNEANKPSFNLLPVTFQLTCYITICYFNYYVISYWLSPVIYSTYISLGLYLFGLFSVFIGRSILFNSTSNVNDEKENNSPREKWKIYLEEFGISAVVAIFICTLPFKAYPLEYSLVAFSFLFLFFLFSGKGLINTIFRLKKEATSYLHFVKSSKRSRKEIQELQKRKEEVEKNKATFNTELQLPETTIKELVAEQAYKTNVFLSEYHLAMQTRQSLNRSQLNQ